MLEVKNVDIKLSTRYLVKSLSFTLNKGDKLAIIGEEGNGKSTLLKSLLGCCDYATMTGTVHKKGTIGFLEQSIPSKYMTKKVAEYLDNTQTNKKLYRYLTQLSLTDTILDQSIETLSGGERVKIGILKLLLDESDIFFLDEPTNDLDIKTLEWLEEFIKTEEKPILYVSHDETLLAHTANMILHIEQIKKKTECKHTLLKIDYDSYIQNRMNAIKHQTQISKSEKREYQKKQKKLQQIMQKVEYRQNTITRSNPHGAKVLKKKMHTLKAQEKRLELEPITETPDVEESIHFFFEDVFIPSHKVIIKFVQKALKVEQNILASSIHLEVIGNTHLCIIGKNGVGKTTLLKQIYEQLKDRTDLCVGYMPQNYDEILSQYHTALDFIGAENKEDITVARMYLGNMNFTKEEMTCPLNELSGGSKAKLFLIKLVIQKCNVLLLDEPTRNVSPLSSPVIRTVLKNFQGTIISISHDRKYIEEVVDVLYVLDKNGLTRVYE